MVALEHYNFTPILGWSVSRYETFKRCKRQYYYNYYGKFDNDYALDVINYYKKLTSIPLEKGNIVHDIIRDTLKRYQKTNAPIDRSRFQTHMFNMTKRYCANKEFVELEYNQLKTIDIKEIYEAVKIAVINFLNSNRFEWIVNTAISTNEEWVVEPAGYGETRFGKLKAYCKVDYLIPLEDKYYILDWKSGRLSAEKHRKQMLGYSLWARNFYNISNKQIIPILAFLYPDFYEVGEYFSDDELNDFQKQIELETSEMYAYCGNINDNVPIRKVEFTMTNNFNICSYCNFRKLCNRENI